MAAKKKAVAARAPARRKTPRKAEAGSAGLDPAACVSPEVLASQDDLRKRIEDEGGAVVGAYLDPLGGKPLLLAVLPIGKVAPTPFQRDLSEAHHKRLAEVIHKTARFLVPLTVIT